MKTTLLRHSLLLFLFLCIKTASFCQTSGYSGTGGNIDVAYHRAEWTINPDAGRTIAGTVTTYFTTKVAAVNKITFDLSGNHTVSATHHGIAIPVSRPSTDVIELTLPGALPINTFDSVSITYSGTPPAFTDYGEGYDLKGTTNKAIYTLSESYGDDDWWPCKADMKDRIDSMDIIITTPSAYRAATNGKLISEVVSGSNKIYRYEHRYSITSYLVAVAVAKYNIFDRGTVNINGTLVPVVYYLYASRGSSPTAELTAMDLCKDELIAFSQKYGDYPFKNEKYGMYEFGWGGGMEHQTFSAMGSGTLTSWSIIAHELAHQWWGDKVTFSTWNHLWLAEGFAKYSEVLAAELVPALSQNAQTHREGIKTTALSTSTTPIYLSNASIANSNVLWTALNDDALYERGAMVVSMLRKLSGDSKFFQACQNYLNDPLLAYKSATTDDLKNHFEAVLGFDLDAFFTDYIWGTGNPAYDVRWGKNGTRVNVQLYAQRVSPSTTVSYFNTPVVLRIYNATKDTTVVIYDNQTTLSYAGNGIQGTRSGRILGYNLSFIPTNIQVDPYSETLVRGQDGTGTQSTVTSDASLNNINLALLDVSVTSFAGLVKEESNQLTLRLAPTQDGFYVLLERSKNGVQFMTLDTMHKRSEADGSFKLEYTDMPPEKGLFYYRTRIVDEKGNVSYSKIISLSNDALVNALRINPNPAQDFVDVKWHGGNYKGFLHIRNSTGAVVYTTSFNAGEQTKHINIRILPVGIYTIELVSEKKNYFKTFTCIR